MVQTLTMSSLYWAAGFLEGEGSFDGRTAQVTATQAESPEPLYYLQSMFGGTIHQRRHGLKPHHKAQLKWSVSGAGVMMTLYNLMSPKRRGQICRALKIWKSRPAHPRYRRHCPQGHPYSPENTSIYNGTRSCRLCRTTRELNRRFRILRGLYVQCPRGHPFDGYLDSRGHHLCRICARRRTREYYARQHCR